MQVPGLVVLVVAYKTPLAEAATIRAIHRWLSTNNGIGFDACCKLVLWDNSPGDRAQGATSVMAGLPVDFRYVHTPENLGLSEIYNTVIGSLQDDDYLLLLDQDTSFPPHFVPMAMAKAAEGHQLVLPQVISGGRIVSPARRIACLGRLQHRWAEGEAGSSNLLAINSGMLISAKVFRHFRYHPDLRFYGTDTWFMTNFERHFQTAYVLPCQLDHQLHMDTAPDRQWKNSYYQEQIRVNRIIYRTGLLETVVTWAYNFYLRICHVRR